jgi:excisionase family DNA binding protein
MPGNPKPNEDRKETYLTIAEAAEYLRVSSRTVYRWLATGKLKFFRVSKSTRIALSDLERFIASNTEGGTEE